MTTMRPISAQYDEMARQHGFEAVWNAMDDAARYDDDDEVTPEDRLARVRMMLNNDVNESMQDLRDSLAEVNGCLAGDAGAHRDLLQRLKQRLEQALA